MENSLTDCCGFCILSKYRLNPYSNGTLSDIGITTQDAILHLS